MKKHLTLFFFLLSCCSIQAQDFSYGNSISRHAFVIYQQDSQGLYQRKEDVSIDKIYGAKPYAYDKKNQTLYARTENANYAIKLYEREAKEAKKNSNIPQLKGDDLSGAILQVTKNLDNIYAEKNRRREIFIQDSIAQVVAAQKAKAREDSIAQALAVENYRKAHDWHWVPQRNEPFYCSLCHKKSIADSAFCLGMSSDSIYYADYEQKDLGLSVFKLHVARIPSELTRKESYNLHLMAFKDSLDEQYSEDLIEYYNDMQMYEYYEKLGKIAPYGYFKEWDWGTNYSNVTFSFRFLNLNKKTIKYINVYWRITNDVQDVRETGNFKGTGPLEQYTSAAWSWDYSNYYVAGDASRMKITKVVLTYMDGTQKVLTGDNIIFN